LYISIGSVIIDDIVLPDGKTSMGILGGGGTHAVMAMRTWSDQVGLIAGVGEDFPQPLMHQLASAFDVTNILRRPYQTIHCWQVFEYNGHRSEIFRTPYEDFRLINPRPEEIPLSQLHVQGVHLHAEAPQPLMKWIARLRKAEAGFILWEPWEVFTHPDNLPAVRAILPLVDAFSPNLEEMREMTGLEDPGDIVHCLLDSGAKLVALRMGELGSMVGRAGEPLLQIPPVTVDAIVDVTGAGNAYCGGFIVGMVETGDPAQAALYGAVSGSLALQQFGAMIPLAGLAEKARGRLELAAH
jgi:sugar/nucleoside kinase (ribokinase family)